MEQYRDILKKNEARDALKKGINLATELVAPTLGVKGNKIFIDKEFGDVDGSDDGVTVLSAIELKDPRMQLGVKILREASSKTNDKEGDGTTTTAILSNELVNQILKDDASKPLDFSKPTTGDVLKVRKGIQNGLKKVIDFINKVKVDITTDEQITNIGRISSNSEEVGKMLMEMFKKLGKDAAVTISDSNSTETTFDIVEGMSFERGYISPAMMTDPEKEEAVIEDANILVTDFKIKDVEHLETLGKLFKGGVNDLLIIADDISGLPLETLVFNKLRGTIRVVAVKAPGFGNQQEYLKDIALLTGAKFISASETLNFKDLVPEEGSEFKIDHALGKAKKVVVTKEKTTIVGGAGDKQEIEARISTLKNRIKDLNGYEKDKMEERISKLSSGVGVIKVGGATELEAKDKKAKILDAVNAVKSALKDGVVAGGGLALLTASTELDESNEGELILKKAIQKPFEQILINADLNFSEMKTKALAEALSGNLYHGYDVENDKWGNMVEMGIIDPAKVVKTALENAVSIALNILTCAGAITLIREEDKKDKNVDN